MLHKNAAGKPCGLVSNIQHYTIHDGPGIRTAVFFVGCTMRCIWCSNPETIEPRPRFGVYPNKCLTREKCGLCVDVCPTGGIGLVEFDECGVLQSVQMSTDCADCTKCADMCPPRAIKVWGEKLTVPELMEEIERDRSFYRRTGGGVTLNGGEVMLQWEFAVMLLRECKAAGINTCIETALHCPPEHMEAVYEYTDLVITDIKHMDSTRHREITGVGNEQILSNIKRTAELSKKLVVRTPIVPGYNADEDNIRRTGRFIKEELNGQVVRYQLLPYRRLGLEKYGALGESYPMGDYVPPERSKWERNLTELASMLIEDYNIPATAGTSEKL